MIVPFVLIDNDLDILVSLSSHVFMPSVLMPCLALPASSAEHGHRHSGNELNTTLYANCERIV
jgi:hypothetical protein